MTEETFKEYAKKERLFDDCVRAEDFEDVLKKSSMLKNPRGLVTLPTMVTERIFKSGDYDAMPVNDFNKLLDDYGNWYIKNIDRENAGYSEPSLNLYIVQLSDPKNKRKLVDIVLFYAEELQAPYKRTKNMIVVFPSDLDDSNLIAYMLNSYSVGQGYFNCNGKKYYYCLSIEAFEGNCNIYITDNASFDKPRADAWENTFFEVLTDSTDKKQLASDLQDLLNDEFGINKEVTNLSVEYFCEPNF